MGNGEEKAAWWGGGVVKFDKNVTLCHIVVKNYVTSGVVGVITIVMCCTSGCGSCAVLLLLECGLYGAKGAGWCLCGAIKLLKLLWHLC